jgi:hypothetical protein
MPHTTQWYDFYRAVDLHGQTMDFLRTATSRNQRDAIVTGAPGNCWGVAPALVAAVAHALIAVPARFNCRPIHLLTKIS